MSDLYMKEKNFIRQLKDRMESKELSYEDLSNIISKYEDLLYQIEMSTGISQRLQDQLHKKNVELKKLKKALV